jgi:hypothetical protein
MDFLATFKFGLDWVLRFQSCPCQGVSLLLNVCALSKDRHRRGLTMTVVNALSIWPWWPDEFAKKNRPRCSPTHFCQNWYVTVTAEKCSKKIAIYPTSPQVNICTIDENTYAHPCHSVSGARKWNDGDTFFSAKEKLWESIWWISVECDVPIEITRINCRRGNYYLSDLVFVSNSWMEIVIPSTCILYPTYWYMYVKLPFCPLQVSCILSFELSYPMKVFKLDRWPLIPHRFINLAFMFLGL